ESNNFILFSLCRPVVSIDPIFLLSMSFVERSPCILWWLPNGFRMATSRIIPVIYLNASLNSMQFYASKCIIDYKCL
ncbi:MAG: hypothetical protein EXX96DRAFT_477115, partial [Benjaminiella poitrasii]